jgi:4-amino-4-deoxy-L-arabinose transferase-like glycosyltransferase
LVEADRRAGLADALPQQPASRLRAPGLLAALRGLRASTDVRWLTGILVLGLVLRLVWVLNVQPDPRDGRFDDTVWYFNTARHLNEGHGYVYPGDVYCAPGANISCDEFPPTALWAPGYTFMVAGLSHLPGDEVAAARGLNVVAGLALIAGVYYLGRRFFGQRAGVSAAAVIALFPSQIFFTSLMLTELVFTAMAVGLVALTLAWTFGREPGPLRLLALGLWAGALAMVRPEGIFFAGLIVLAWLCSTRSWRRTGVRTALLAAGIAVFIVPWTVRNAVQLDSPVLGTTGLGQVLRQAHHPASDGHPEFWIAAELWRKHVDLPFPEREVTINETGIRESVDYAFGNIGRELKLAPQRFAAFYQGDRGAIDWNQIDVGTAVQPLSDDTAERLSILSDVYYYAVLGIGLIGLPLWLRRMGARHLLLWGPIALYSAMWFFLFVGESRYHFPLLPFFALFAGIGLAALAERLRGERPDTP